MTRARNGDRQAWDALADRYGPLIWSICRQYRLEAARLAIPAGSTGPRRRLDKLRRHPAITALTNAGTQAATPDAWPQ